MKKNRASGSARPLSQEEIADLREDMQIASEWTKQGTVEKTDKIVR